MLVRPQSNIAATVLRSKASGKEDLEVTEQESDAFLSQGYTKIMVKQIRSSVKISQVRVLNF
jgi:hypothetical protein